MLSLGSFLSVGETEKWIVNTTKCDKSLKGDTRQHRRVLSQVKAGCRKLPEKSKSKHGYYERLSWEEWGGVRDYNRIPGKGVKIGENMVISK